jgi:hypothetical protein
MNATAVTALTCALALLSGSAPVTAAYVAAATAGVLLLPVLATTIVFAWHAWHGSDPGLAARHLLTLVRILWARPRR